MSESQEVFDIVAGNFELEKCDIISNAELHFILTQRIRELLDKNVEKLIHILYRIDVNQKKTDSIFNNPFKDEIAEQLASAVIERQLQKIETRNKFKSKN